MPAFSDLSVCTQEPRTQGEEEEAGGAGLHWLDNDFSCLSPLPGEGSGMSQAEGRQALPQPLALALCICLWEGGGGGLWLQ